MLTGIGTSNPIQRMRTVRSLTRRSLDSNRPAGWNVTRFDRHANQLDRSDIYINVSMRVADGATGGTKRIARRLMRRLAADQPRHAPDKPDP
jgi:hypothetical protein